MCLVGAALVGSQPSFALSTMFTFAAFCYMLSLVLCASLIFFAIWHVSTGWVVLLLLCLLLLFVSCCCVGSGLSAPRCFGLGARDAGQWRGCAASRERSP